MEAAIDFTGNIQRFSGFAGLYDRYRPSPPGVLAGLLARLAGVDLPEHVVDLGSGTGLSTRYWQDKAARVTGIEPSGDMRGQAEAVTTAPNVTYRAGFSHETGLPGECAQIVTCAQSLHWMDPNGTFPEVQQILVPGGVFAAFDYDWPPTTGSWQADLAFQDCLAAVSRIEKEREQSGQRAAPRALSWAKEQHLERMAQSGCFRFTKEIVLHHIETGSAERLVGLAMSQGSLMNLLKQGLPETAFGLDSLRKTAEQTLGDAPREWVWSCRVRLGIK